MGGFLKRIGMSILYVILFPVIIVGICVYGVVGIIIYFIQLVRIVILFFSGKTIYSDTEEDIAARAILNPTKPEEENKEEAPSQLSLYPSDSPVYTSNYASPFVEEKKSEPQPTKLEEPEEKEYEEDIARFEEDEDDD